MRCPVLLLLFACWPLYAEIRVKDDLGNDVVIAARAERIVSLAPHLTELLFTLGVGQRIVGTVKYSDYPEQARQIPRLGDAFTLSVEAVLELQPDIVFAWHTGGANRSIDRLRELKIPVYINESANLLSIADGVVRMASLVSTRQAGLKLKQQFIQALASVQVQTQERPLVFLQVSEQDLYTINDEHLIGQAINHCGGRNLFANLSPAVALISKEAVLAARPDVILVTQAATGPTSPWIERWNVYESLRGKVKVLNAGLISRPSFRMLAGIRELCRLIQDKNQAGSCTHKQGYKLHLNAYSVLLRRMRWRPRTNKRMRTRRKPGNGLKR